MPVEAGARLGPYQITSRIGAGGMGEVFRARDTRLDRDVAIKVLPEKLAADPDRMQRFEQEARAAGALNHPNLVTVHDVGSENGTTYVVMELLEGESLREKLGEEPAGPPIPVRKAVDYSVQIANGLSAAHGKGIIHRDLKPDNIFITRDGRVKILDFGLAKLLAPRSDESDVRTQQRGTAPGTVLGTVGYMSPEQVRGRDVDHRSDIFSLGTIIYEMLSGRRAFHRDSSIETMNAILKEDPAEIHDSGIHVPVSIERVMRRCLEKSPDERFESAHDIAFALDAVSTSSSQPAIEAVTAPSRSWIVPASILVALAVVAATAVIAWRAGRNAAGTAVPRTAARQYLQLTFSAREMFPSLSPDGKNVAFSSTRAGNNDIYVQRVDGRNAINLTKDSPLGDFQPAFSPDGSSIAFRSDRDGGGIFVMGATGESVRRLTDFGFSPAWAPDGKRIAISSEPVAMTPRSRSGNASLWVIDLRSGEKRKILEKDAVQPSWSPHGNRIAYWGLVGESGQRDLWTVDPNAAKPETTVVRVTNDPALDWNPVWSPDGRWLYFGSDRDGTINLWRIAVDESAGTAHGAPEPIALPAIFAGHFSFARETGDLAFLSIDQTGVTWRLPFDPVTLSVTGKPVRVIGGALIPFLRPAVSPDGQWLVFSNAGAQQDLYLVRTDGSDLRQLTNDPELDRGPSFSQDGRAIYFYSQRGGRYEMWSIRTDGSALRKLSTETGPSYWHPRLMPGGNALYAFNQEAVAIIPFKPDGTLGKPELLPPMSPAEAHMSFPSVSPDGGMLAGVVPNPPDLRGLWVYSFANRGYERIVPEITTSQWLPTSKTIVLGRRANQLLAIDVVKKTSREIPLPISSFTEIVIAPDGRAIYLIEPTVDSVVWLMRER